jgi:hypothetical protein
VRFLIIAVVLLAACSSQSASTPTRPASPSPNVLAGGCGSNPILRGSQPQWLVDAGANNNPDLPYVIASPPVAAGFLFGYPLRAGHPENPTNKILWVVGKPRNGSALGLSGHPTSATTPVVDESAPDNASPGEIYPSIVDAPSPGCWHFDLTWDGNHASVDLAYR